MKHSMCLPRFARLLFALVLLAVPLVSLVSPAQAAGSGTVTAWGYDAYGQTDVPAGLTGVVAIAAGYAHTVALKNDGTVVAWGYDAYGQTDVPAGLTGVVAIAAGYVHTVALVKQDTTAPTFGACPAAGPFLLNSGVQTVGPIAASDETGGSGLDTSASTLTGSVDTSTVGTKTVTFTAVDQANNQATTTCNYQVIYNWAGFFQPVDNLPTFNSVKAGSAIPVMFSLGGDQGLSIFAAGYPVSKQISCSTSAPVDAIEQTVTAGSSSLSYDATSGQYTYVWKTDKTWTGQCRQLILRLTDGTDHVANFQFK